MATITFSVPDDVKQAFDERFEGRDRDEVLADLMRRAVEEDIGKEKRRGAMQALAARTAERPAFKEESARRALGRMRGGS